MWLGCVNWGQNGMSMQICITQWTQTIKVYIYEQYVRPELCNNIDNLLVY